MRYSVLWEKTGRVGLQIVVNTFRRKFYECNFMHLIPRKALKSVTETSAPWD